MSHKENECLSTNLNEDIKSKIKVIDYCDCPFCTEIISMIKERSEMLQDE